MRTKRILALLLCAVMLASLGLPAAAEEAGDAAPEEGRIVRETIHVASVEDFRRLAGNCALDSYSAGLTVVLDNDLELGADTVAIPIFNGIFEGGGHTVSGLTLTGGSNLGLFRYVQSEGVIRDLNVEGSVQPDEGSDKIGGRVGTSYGRIYGQRPGYATITATTHDGGYSTTTNVVVDDFNGMVACDSAYIDADNKIRVSFRNKSWYYTVDAVYFRVDCYDTQGNPIVCTADGGTSFNGTYPLTLEPGGYTLHGRFNFNNYRETGLYGYVTVTVTGYAFDNGQKWWIPEDQQITFPSTNSIHWGEPTPAPAGDPEESNG